ncbi:helix-turn-helix domain-containing protein [Nocardia sp. NPDC058666]|uniref:helix-turn-helix domain-containing protein n=1 Tax=unclassified Nocardia TaxID=2637762 RepID=UPI00366256EF
MSKKDIGLYAPTLANHLTWARERAGLTAPALDLRANVSVSLIRKLESGEKKNTSEQTLRSLASGLALTGATQWRYLSDLNRMHIPKPWSKSEVAASLTAAEQEQLRELSGIAAAFLNERWDILGSTPRYEELFPGIGTVGNVARWLFSDAGRRTVVDWEDEAAQVAALMRGLMAHFDNPEWGRVLISELGDDADFDRLWRERGVAYDRTAESPIYVRTASGPMKVVMQFRPVTERPDMVHLALAFPQPPVTTAA